MKVMQWWLGLSILLVALFAGSMGVSAQPMERGKPGLIGGHDRSGRGPDLGYMRFFVELDRMDVSDEQLSSLRKAVRTFRSEMEKLHRERQDLQWKLEMMLRIEKDFDGKDLAKKMGSLEERKVLILVSAVAEARRVLKDEQWAELVRLAGASVRKGGFRERRSGFSGKPGPEGLEPGFPPPFPPPPAGGDEHP